jgi:hypothetical protein
VVLSSLSFDLRLTIVIDHEEGWARPYQVTSPATAIDLLPHDPINLKVFTDHANLMIDALGMTSHHVYQWRLLLEEYRPKIVYIKSIHNTIADAISWLGYDPSVNRTAENYHLTKVKRRSLKRSQRQCWMTVSKHWCNLGIDTIKLEDSVFVFANHREEDEIYPLTTIEIAEAQRKDQELKVYYKKNARLPKKDVCLQLIEDTKKICKNGKLIIPASLQYRGLGTTTTSSTLVTHVSKRQ